MEMSHSLPPKGWLRGSLRRCCSVAGMATKHVGSVRILDPPTWGRLGGLIVLPL